MKIARSWGLMLAAAMALPGCGGSLAGFCANEEIAAGLELRVADSMGSDGHPRAGSYHFLVTTEFGAVEWSCEIGLEDRLGSACAVDHELPAETGESHLLVSSVTTAEKFWIDLKVIDTAEWRGPAEVQIEISRDDEVVANEQYTPSYELSPASGAAGCPNYYAAGESPTIDL